MCWDAVKSIGQINDSCLAGNTIVREVELEWDTKVGLFAQWAIELAPAKLVLNGMTGILFHPISDTFHMKYMATI